MNNIQEISFEKFLNLELKKISLLFGNGLLLSHPEEAVRSSFLLSKDEHREITKKLYESVEDYIKSQKTNCCPEEHLNYIRKFYGAEVFIKYLEKQNSLTNLYYSRCTNFIKKFKSIYTLNYDTFTYACRQGANLIDGFKGESYIPISALKNRIEQDNKGIPFYYLHGAFFILTRTCEDKRESLYKKIKSTEGDLSGTLIEIYKKLTSDYQKSIIESLPQPEEDLVLIFAGQHFQKHTDIKNDPYLNYCMEQFKNEANIFSFGCSFKFDKHLLDALLAQKNDSEKTVYIGYHSTQDKENISNIIRSKAPAENIIIFLVNLSDSSVSTQIWGQ